MKTPDATVFLFLSYKNWGLLVFFCVSFVALFALLKRSLRYLFGKEAFFVPLKLVIVTSALIPLLFFYFNTQMHERYSHPAMVFLILYAVIYKRIWPAILGSIAYLLNLEAVYKHMKLGNDYNLFVFNRLFISLLFLATILWLFYDMFAQSKSNERQLQ
jgi:hypothetical protein